MLDWFVVLTPVVVLAVVLLLGFAGCDVVFGIEPVPQPLRFEVRVPSSLTVDTVGFRYTPPGSTNIVTVTSPARVDESADVILFFHEVGDPPVGMWTVNCRLDVKDASGADTDAAGGDFLVEELQRVVARWEAMGSPATNDFRVVFVGATAE